MQTIAIKALWFIKMKSTDVELGYRHHWDMSPKMLLQEKHIPVGGDLWELSTMLVTCEKRSSSKNSLCKAVIRPIKRYRISRLERCLCCRFPLWVMSQFNIRSYQMQKSPFCDLIWCLQEWDGNSLFRPTWPRYFMYCKCMFRKVHLLWTHPQTNRTVTLYTHWGVPSPCTDTVKAINHILWLQNYSI